MKKQLTTEQKLRRLIRSEIKNLNEEDGHIESIDNRIDKYFKKLVPVSGRAQTIEGEMIRAISRVLYRYYNDGDFFFRGYGKETVLPSVQWLVQKSPLAGKINKHFSSAKNNAPKLKKQRYGWEADETQYTDNDGYQKGIYMAANMILDYVDSKNGEYTDNQSDSR